MTTSISNFRIHTSINNILKSLVILLVFCFAANSSFAQYQLPQKYQIKKAPTYQLKKPIHIPQPSCPDLKAMPIQFQILSRPTPYTARVRVTATIKNIGGTDYISGSNQQSMQLYIGSTPVKNEGFANLAKGTTRTITYDMTYSTSNEFPPMIKLFISYDPDIAIDGNPKNDECTYSNNQSSRDSSEIGGML
ncbi:MAG: hypothetical protein R3E32_17035 [Chitinophagales bacterium]